MATTQPANRGPPSQPDHLPALNDYHQWHKKVSRSYVAFNGEERSYVPKDEVNSYFKVDRRIENILREIHSPKKARPNVEDIKKHCLLGFCILLDIGESNYVRHFAQEEVLRDDHLPLQAEGNSLPAEFPGGSNAAILWSRFRQTQYEYTSVTLKDGTNYFKDCVVPFLSKKKIGSGGSATLYHVMLPAANIDKARRPRGEPRAFALKVFRGQRGFRFYDIEQQNYRTLRRQEGGSVPGLIDYKCGYRHGDTYNILLEHADKGSLEDMLKNEEPPRTGAEILEFFKAFLEILHAICRIHQLPENNYPGEDMNVRGFHQDLHPGKILLVSRSPSDNGKAPASESTYPVKFKLADLGHCTLIAVGGGATEVVSVRSTQGGQAHGAANDFRGNDGAKWNINKITSSKVDVYSMGCILLVVCVWVISGSKGVVTFEEQRKNENAHHNSQHGDLARFHNGHASKSESLEAVHEQFDDWKWAKILDADFVTVNVLNRLVEHMIQETPVNRLTAPQSRKEAQSLLHEASKELQRYEARFKPRPENKSRSDGCRPTRFHEHFELSNNAVWGVSRPI